MALATDLGLYIENTPPARGRHVLNGHEAGTVKIAGELSVFDECAISDHLLERFLSHEIVVFSVGLSWARWTSRVWIKRLGWKNLKKCRAGSLRETLNPNLVGWFAKSLVSKVDLPTPDGPDSTKGLRKSEAMVTEDIADRIQNGGRVKRDKEQVGDRGVTSGPGRLSRLQGCPSRPRRS